MTAPPTVRRSAVGSGVSFEAYTNVVVVRLGASIDDQTAERLLSQTQSALALAPPDARLLLDARDKSFTSLTAQKRWSSGAHDANALPKVEAIALWVGAARLAQAADYSAPELQHFTDPESSTAPSWVRDRWLASRQRLHLIAGCTGAGKSTYGLRLAEDIGGIYLGIDDWMTRLFGPDRPQSPGFDWYMDRIERCEEQMWRVACSSHRVRTPTVLDLGLTTSAHRARLLAWAQEAKLPARLHYVDAPSDRRWRRVTERNERRGETYRLEVTREMFDFMEGIFEPPDAEECADFVHCWT